MKLPGVTSEDSREREGNIILGWEEKTMKKTERAASGIRRNAWVGGAGKAEWSIILKVRSFGRKVSLALVMWKPLLN